MILTLKKKKKTRLQNSYSSISDQSVMGPVICISDRDQADADAAGPRTTLLRTTVVT